MRRILGVLADLVLILTFASFSFARPVDSDIAIGVGRTHLQAQEQSWRDKAHLAPATWSRSMRCSIQGVRELNVDGRTFAYILDLSPEGCIVVSPDTDIRPVIAHSSEGRFSMQDTPGNVLLHLLKRDMRNRLEALPIVSERVKGSNNALWEGYLNHEQGFIQQLSSAETWGPWLNTNWHQRYPYNKYCPRLCSDDDPVRGENCYVGCTATAMAQIIYYWKHPRSLFFYSGDRYTTETGIRIDEDFVISFGELNVVLSDIKYDGDEDEIAALCFACGVSVQMDYGCDKSGAVPSAGIFRSRFGYASADCKDEHDADFYTVLEENMRNEQPALLAIWAQTDDVWAHSLVADGFRSPGEYHLNFGGGSIDDCWYSLPLPATQSDAPLSYEMKRSLGVVNYGIMNIYPQYEEVAGVSFRGSSYIVVDERMSWQEARAYAESLGGYLVTIGDEEENRFVTELAAREVIYRFWIGLSDEEEEGRFVWVTGEPLIYQNWYVGEPNDYGRGEDYVESGYGSPYSWNDNNDSWTNPFVVEFGETIHTFRGNSYVVINQNTTWQEARAYAKSLSGHLVTISDEEENCFVAELAIEKGVLQSFWIGLTDELEEGRFAWITGEPLIYQNWYPGEPNNYGGDEDYVEVGFPSAYLWNDNDNSQTNPFVVEFEVTVAPTEAVLTVQVSSGSFSREDSFSVAIDIANVTDMAGFQLGVVFDPAILEASKMEEGSFLSDSGGTYWLEPNINNTKGTITGVMGAKTGKGGVDGGGTLATIVFKAIGTGETSIELCNISLSDSNGRLIPVTAVDGKVTVTELPPWDVNGDRRVDVLDFVLVGQRFGEEITEPVTPNPDVNGDGKVDVCDFILVGRHFGEIYLPAVPSRDVWSVDARYLPILIRMYDAMEEDSPSSDPDFLATKRLLRRLIFSAKASRTEVFQNYPNPFNPDTWIPYQLREDAEVIIRIYTATGQLVRTLNLGRKSGGIYISKERAAYWDGRNAEGEESASGIYLYTVQAGDFAATKKMVIAR